MRSILCVCNTYLQVIISIMMRSSLFSEEQMTLILTDHSNGGETVFSRLKNEIIFNDVMFVKTKELDQGEHNWFQAINDIVSMICGKIEKKYDCIGEKYFDTLLYYNESTFTSMLFAKLYRMSSDLKVAKYEEGILSYRNAVLISKRQKIAFKMRKMIGKKNLSDMTDLFYCNYPEYYDGKLKVEQIPKDCSHDSQVLDLIKRVFLGDVAITPYEQRYIYFSSVCDFEGESPINELDLIELIAKTVGRENLLVKVHPRDDRRRFEKLGVQIDQNSNVPWEAIQFAADFSNHIFLTAHSSSVLTVNMLLEHPAETYFLYSMCNIEGNSIALQSVRSVETLLNDCKLCQNMKWLHISNSLDEILN